MKFKITGILLLQSLQFLFAQNALQTKFKIDSLNKKLYADSLRTYRFKPLRPYANIDNRNSYIKNKPASFNGLQLGIIVNEFHTFGIGFYNLNQAAIVNSPVDDSYRIKNLSYRTIFYEYMHIDKRYYELDFPFELGYGRYRAFIRDTLMFARNDAVKSWYLPVGAGIKVVLKPVRWIGLSLMVGYRYVFEKNSVLDLNGFFFPLGIWIDFRQIYRDIKFYGFQKKRYKREKKKLLSLNH